ncbi:hypothetical protein HAZT_HAZT008021 [Hyalella azteca]|uniref:Ion transport domain-containing protein n=1 Tax=Hyalella azteca TaxID=294128 RepID=A0A6A0GZJ9_HYAAZ|nr:hypothetical protein HAZT_HAZT008021 [Hyalella azteca]
MTIRIGIEEEIEIIFMVIFTLECGMKILAYGFVMHQGAYLRSVWNFIDFLIVVIGMVMVQADQRRAGHDHDGVCGDKL